jgi:hypothetical protein
MDRFRTIPGPVRPQSKEVTADATAFGSFDPTLPVTRLKANRGRARPRIDEEFRTDWQLYPMPGESKWERRLDAQAS